MSSSCSAAVNEGSDCRLTCTASGGNPQTYSYQWKFQLKFSSSYQAVSGGTTAELLLRSVSYIDSGSYKCIVGNDGGESSHEVDAIVKCKFGTVCVDVCTHIYDACTYLTI